MPFNLDDLNPGTRFLYETPEGDETGEWVELRICSGEELNKIYKQTRKKITEYRKGIRYSFEDIDSDLEAELMHDYAIVDWHIVDDNDKEIPCTKENKNLLMNNSIEFASFVTARLKILNEKFDIFEEDREKN